MEAYLARLNRDQDNPREIVGIFVAEDRDQLVDLIDECCDADRVEILPLGPGGLYWSQGVSFVVPHPDDMTEEPDDIPAGANVSDYWARAFYDENEGQWERIRFKPTLVSV